MNKLQEVLRPIRLVGLAFAVLLCSTGLRAQGLEKSIEQFGTGDAVKGYIQPIADFFGANMNSGWYHSAEIAQGGIHIEVDLVGMGSSVGDASKTFDEKLPAGFSAATFKAPTVFGSSSGAVYTDPNTNLSYGGSGGVINTSIFPFAVPQLTVGSIMGTEAVLRYIATPDFSSGKFPKTSLFGLGVRHSVSQYLPMVPLDLAGGILYNTFSVGSLITFKSVAIGVQGSKSFAIATVYGGLQWEHSTLTLSYTPTEAGIPPISVDMTGANTVRATLGGALSLAFFKIFADVNVGSVTVYSGGVGFGL